MGESSEEKTRVPDKTKKRGASEVRWEKMHCFEVPARER